MRPRIVHLVSVLALGLLAPGAFVPALAGSKEDDAAEKAFLSDYAKAGEDEKKRAEAVTRLGANTDPATAPSDLMLVSLLASRVLPKDSAPVVHKEATKVLFRVKEDKAVKALLEEATGKGPWDCRSTLFEVLGRVENPAVVPAMVKVLKGSETKAQAAALFTLARRSDAAGARDAIKPLVENKAWQVRLAVYECLSNLKDTATLLWLVDMLPEETGRMRQELLSALRKISGRNFKENDEQWRVFAHGGDEAVKALIAGTPPAEGATPPEGAAPSSTGTTSTTADKVTPTYYGIKVYSDRVVFVIDLSLSMNEEMVIDRDRMARETGAVATGRAAEDPKAKPDEFQGLEWWKIRTRMDFARAQLKYVVSILDKDQFFDIVWFSDSVVTWQGSLVPATAHNKVKAADWLDGLECEGGTATWDGLMKGMNLVGKGSDEENYRRGADTIYFMSDGMPSKGAIVETDKIVANLERIFKVRRVKINVVQIGSSVLPFMQDIANVTGGEFKFFKAGEPKNLPPSK